MSNSHNTLRNVITVGQPATLSENDCFGSTTNVIVLKIHKGGNVIVLDGDVKREVSASNLRPSDQSQMRMANPPDAAKVGDRWGAYRLHADGWWRLEPPNAKGQA